MTYSRRDFLTMLGITASAAAVIDSSDGLIGRPSWLDASPRTTPMVTHPFAANDPSALSRLLVQLTDGDPQIRGAAVQALGRVDDVEAVGDIGRILNEADRHEAAAYALAWIISEA